MKFGKKLFSATAAAVMAGAFLFSSPEPAQAQWWNLTGWFDEGRFNDFDYYADYDGYYDANLSGPDWNWWWS